MEEITLNRPVTKKTAFGGWSLILGILNVSLIFLGLASNPGEWSTPSPVEVTILTISWYGSLVLPILSVIFGLISIKKESGRMRKHGIFGLTIAAICFVALARFLSLF